MAKNKKKRVGPPGRTWRFSSTRLPIPNTKLYEPGIDIRSRGHYQLDELVIDNWFHLEQMDNRDYWLRVGNKTINIHINPDGSTKVMVEDNV